LVGYGQDVNSDNNFLKSLGYKVVTYDPLDGLIISNCSLLSGVSSKY